MIYVVVFVVVVVVVLLVIVSMVQEQQRQDAVQAVAQQHGLTYSEGDPERVLDLPFRLLRQGDRQKVMETLYGTMDDELLTVFRLRITEESTDSDGDTSETHTYFTGAIVHVPLGGFPPIRVQPENFLTRAKDLAGFRDIEFESEEFNRQYEINSKDRRAAHAVIDAQMMEWLLGLGGGYEFEVVGNMILALTRAVDPPRTLLPFEIGRRFRAHIPEVAMSLYPSTGGR